ncbi:MAG: hypothetical protein ACRDOK_10330, partial [Streptosporangiaceae bacterium]
SCPVLLPAAEDARPPSLPGRAGMVATRVADLAWPAGRGQGKNGRTALTAAGAGKIRTGDLVVFCKPVAVAPAVVRRDGRVQAAGHPADHVRLGVAEDRLEALTGMGDRSDRCSRGADRHGEGQGAAGDDTRAGDPADPADDDHA